MHIATRRVEDRAVGEALGHMCAIPTQRGRAQRGPDESLGDVRVAGIERFQISVGLPLLNSNSICQRSR